MSEKLKQKRAELARLISEGKTLAAELETKGDRAAPEDHERLARLISQAKALRDEVDRLQALAEMDGYVNAPAERRIHENPQSAIYNPQSSRARWGRVKNFARGSAAESEEAAYRFGKWFAAALCGHEPSLRWCQEHGVKVTTESGLEVKTMKESVATSGGYLVPSEFDNDLIDLRERHGVFRRNARIVPMMRDTKSIGRRTAGLTAYFTGEAAAVTESEKGWDLVTLTARKLMTLTRVSSELEEDIMVALGDDLAGEIAYAFANKEDECGFNGDGTSAFGGIVGVREKLKGLDATIANIAGLVVASGNQYSEITLNDFNSVVGRLPEYADGPNTKWYCSRFFWATVMQRLAVAAGGVTAEEIEGRRMRTFLGYPVEVTQVMPKVEANSQVCCLFGDLRQAARFGDRRQTVISMSEHRYFDTDEIGVKGTERFDIVVHDVGNAQAVASLREPGPVVGLITAAS
ncbi:MAG TPA: phage major capsid protein [Blastocatellia bacterium]|nr:phage major capsid protein [Blastocatellia bacterium]